MNSYALTGDNPASPFVWILMLVFVGGFVATILGTMAIAQKPRGKIAVSRDLLGMLVQLSKEPGWPLENKLAVGGIAACFGSLSIIFLILQFFGTRA